MLSDEFSTAAREFIATPTNSSSSTRIIIILKMNCHPAIMNSTGQGEIHPRWHEFGMASREFIPMPMNSSSIA